jgi:hypothetical protein
MENAYKLKYNVDIVFVIDSTGSMGHLVQIVKNNALDLHVKLAEAMRKKQKTLNKVRVRLISFKDYVADQYPMLGTKFFSLPDEEEQMKAALQSIRAEGGGDDPEDALEALAHAIKSDWAKGTDKGRQVIVLYTDTGAHDLGFGRETPKYSKGMPANLAELTAWWNDPAKIDQDQKRFVLFAPNDKPWDYISANWGEVVHAQTKAGAGLSEYDMQQIVDVISNSISSKVRA